MVILSGNLWTLHIGDVCEVLRSLPASSVHCCVTSPPYWGLRDYGLPPSVWPSGWKGNFGLEPTIELYIENTLTICREIRRVMREDAVLWWNLGSSYSSKAIPSEQMTLRDDITEEERAYVLSEIARIYGAKPEAVPDMQPADTQAKSSMPTVP